MPIAGSVAPAGWGTGRLRPMQTVGSVPGSEVTALSAGLGRLCPLQRPHLWWTSARLGVANLFLGCVHVRVWVCVCVCVLPISRPALFYCTFGLHRYGVFYELKVYGNLALSKSVDAIFPAAPAHFMSLSHFGNPCNISDFFILTIFVTVSVIVDVATTTC